MKGTFLICGGAIVTPFAACLALTVAGQASSTTLPKKQSAPLSAAITTNTQSHPKVARADLTRSASAIPMAPRDPLTGADGMQGATGDSSSSNLAIPIKITLTPSETPIKLGSTSNIAADIVNASNRPVEVDTTSVQLMSHAILSQTDTLCVAPLFPVSNSVTTGLVILQPQDHISVLFNLSQRALSYSDQQLADIAGYEATKPTMLAPAAVSSGAPNDTDLAKQAALGERYRKVNQEVYDRSCDPNLIGPIKRALDFSPGNYEYFLLGKYSVCDPAQPFQPIKCEYPRYFSQNATFQVGIDQTQIIIFAIFGGLLAYLVVNVRSDDGAFNELFARIGSKDAGAAAPSRSFWILLFLILRDMAGVAILSAAFTIVCSRLSDSQFPIKISVLDAWGAMTIGFLSYFAGNKFIASLQSMVK
jgi:hypothetical protein